MSIVLPSLIQGQCYLLHGGVVTYFKNGIQLSDDVVSWTPESTAYGARRHGSNCACPGADLGKLSVCS